MYLSRYLCALNLDEAEIAKRHKVKSGIHLNHPNRLIIRAIRTQDATGRITGRQLVANACHVAEKLSDGIAAC